MISDVPTEFIVNCVIHGRVYLTKEEFVRQKGKRICPIGREPEFSTTEGLAAYLAH